MRPHLLELSAFGSFPGVVRLDLDELGESGLVLFCGETGGGKSTLLDALGFALYGVVPGERRKAKDDLRSHHSAASAQTWVRLTFTARGQRLRVTRSPEWQRPKQRGSGTIKEQASARLERWDGGDWEPVAQRLDDVGLEITRLLGMDSGQFFQVVLLPQGRFADFLQADHKDRERLLKQLFHVSRFEDVERWLADSASNAVAAVEGARGALARLAARLGQVVDQNPPEALDDVLVWAEAAAAEAERERSVQAGAVRDAQQARGLAEQRLTDAERLADRQHRRRDALARLEQLASRQAGVEELAAELARAERARPVVVAAEAVQARAAEFDAAAAQSALATQALGRHDAVDGGPGGGSGGGGEEAERAVGDRAAAARIQAGRVDALRAVAGQRRDAEQRAAQQAEAAAELTRSLATTARRAAQLPAERVAAGQRLAAARAAAARLPALAAELEQARRGERLRQELGETTAALHTGQARLDAAEAELATARERAAELRELRFEAMTAELAALLVPDSPCFVCGSLDHPDIAETRGDDVTRAAERAAEADAGRLAGAVVAVSREVIGLQERSALLATERDALPLTDLAELTARQADLTRVAAEEGHVDDDLTRLAAEDVGLATRTAREQAELGERQRQVEELLAAAAAARLQLVTELGEDQDPDRRHAELVALALACEALVLARGIERAAAGAHDDALGVALKHAAEVGFPDLATALEAARPSGWIADAADTVRVHREQALGLQQALASPELAVDLDTPAPVEAERAAAVAAAARHEAAARAHGLADSRADQLAALLPEVHTCAAAVGPLLTTAAELRGLAEVAAGRGGNRLSMSLSTFVLAARLEEVAQAASVRLERMSGRFTLLHSDGARDKRTRAGLGLRVLDSWTGRTRETATLSGGETFMTALSLALGLADVVTAETGGQSIDALFVDEGFGSLDADSLDQVMDSLDELRSSGRLVGIVSHVADLKQRIPTQVVVVKGLAGSTVEVPPAH